MDCKPQLAADAAPDVRWPSWLPVFFINRDCDGERRQRIEGELAKAHLAGERVKAADGLAVDPGLRPYFFNGDRLASKLSPGEVGCYASHLSISQLILQRGVDHALVLEDDAVLPANLGAIMLDLLDKLPWDWDLVHLCQDPTHAIKPVARLMQSRLLVRYSRVPPSTVGYLIRRSGAKKFLAPGLRLWPVDTDLRQPWQFEMSVYGVAPKVIAHADDLHSAVLAFGERSRLRRGMRRPAANYPVGNPLHTSHGAFYNFRTLGPLWWAHCWWQNTLRRLRMKMGGRSRPAL